MMRPRGPWRGRGIAARRRSNKRKWANDGREKHRLECPKRGQGFLSLASGSTLTCNNPICQARFAVDLLEEHWDIDLGFPRPPDFGQVRPVSYTHLRAHETRHDLVC